MKKQAILLTISLLGLLSTQQDAVAKSYVYQGTVFHVQPGDMYTALDWSGNLPIHHAAASGDEKDIIQFLQWGANVNSNNRYGQTPLMKAVQNGNITATLYLLNNGATITQADHPLTRYTPFHYALALPKERDDDIKKIITLLALLTQHDFSKQYINTESRHGTPLEFALARDPKLLLIKVLLNNGAQITDRAKNIARELDSTNQEMQDIRQLILGNAN